MPYLLEDPEGINTVRHTRACASRFNAKPSYICIFITQEDGFNRGYTHTHNLRAGRFRKNALTHNRAEQFRSTLTNEGTYWTKRDVNVRYRK